MPMTEQEAAFVRELGAATFYMTLRELLAAMDGHASLPIAEELLEEPEKAPSPAERALVHVPAISWRTTEDWAAYCARMEDGALTAFFMKQAENEALSENARKTARTGQKNVKLYKEDLSKKISAPLIEDGRLIDVGEFYETVLCDGIVGAVSKRFVQLYDSCQNGMNSAYLTAEDRMFYKQAMQAIDTYLRGLGFVPIDVSDGMRIDGYELYFTPSMVPTDDTEKIGRFSAISFPPYVAHYGDNPRDIVCIDGRCIIWTPK